MTTKYPIDVLERAARVKLFGFDVDGTLTDGQLHYGTDGHEAKSFHVQDGMGFTLLRHAGIVLALVTARISPVVERRGRELQVPHIHTGERSKLACMQRIAAGMGIGMVLFWVLIIAGIVALVMYVVGDRRTQQPSQSPDQILAARFARGEISETEYRDRLAILRDPAHQ